MNDKTFKITELPVTGGTCPPVEVVKVPGLNQRIEEIRDEQARIDAGGRGSDVQSLGVSESEWRAELERCGALADAGAPGLTRREFMEKFDLRRWKATEVLNRLVGEGRAKRAMGRRTDCTGRRYEVPVYELKKGK